MTKGNVPPAPEDEVDVVQLAEAKAKRAAVKAAKKAAEAEAAEEEREPEEVSDYFPPSPWEKA